MNMAILIETSMDKMVEDYEKEIYKEYYGLTHLDITKYSEMNAYFRNCLMNVLEHEGYEVL